MKIAPAPPLRGEVSVPGDKGISHRALLLNTLVPGGVSVLSGLPDGEDVAATANACRQLGARIEPIAGGVRLQAPEQWQSPQHPIDCGNSGTSIRLLLGALAASEVTATLGGDNSLERRPMGRLTSPLRRMNASITGPSDGERAPLTVHGRPLRPFDHVLPVASAQLKSALLLAGLQCGVRVREPACSRDHSERMLRAMGASLADEDGWLSLAPSKLHSLDVEIPGDLSSAAFLLVAAAIVPGSELTMRGIGINPTRTGVLDVLRAMGASLDIINPRDVGGEPVGDLVMRHSSLTGTEIRGDLALRSIDEIVVLGIAAAFAEGQTTIADARELRVKESDRLAKMALGLRSLGISVEEREDGLIIEGGHPKGPATIDATGDHRIAMAFAVAGLASPGGVTIEGANSVRSSWPAFFALLGGLH